MCMQVNPNSGLANEDHLRCFNMVGRLLGKALMDGQITPVHLVQPLYKHLMGWPVTLKDLEHIDDQVYRNLTELLDCEDVNMLYLEFVVTEDHLGRAVDVPLIEGGAEMMVNSSNLPAYLEAQLRYRMFNRTRAQLLELLKGFYDVVPEPLLAVFDFQELELLLHGLPNIDMDDWTRHTEYTGEFGGQPNHKVAQWFWEIVRSFEQEQKAKLLQFVTGTAGVPVQGFQALQGNDGNIRKFTLHGDKNVKVFPRAHTCFNRIDIPIYKTKAEMQKYLTMAISYEASGFDIGTTLLRIHSSTFPGYSVFSSSHSSFPPPLHPTALPPSHRVNPFLRTFEINCAFVNLLKNLLRVGELGKERKGKESLISEQKK